MGIFKEGWLFRERCILGAVWLILECSSLANRISDFIFYNNPSFDSCYGIVDEIFKTIISILGLSYLPKCNDTGPGIFIKTVKSFAISVKHRHLGHHFTFSVTIIVLSSG
jgi:hypothetical protein